MKNKKVKIAALSVVTVFTVLGSTIIALPLRNVKASAVELEVHTINYAGTAIDVVDYELIKDSGLKAEISTTQTHNFDMAFATNEEEYKQSKLFRGNVEILQFLGVDAKQVKEYYSQGKNFIDIANEKGVDVEELRQILKIQLQDKLDDTLETGQITQKEYNKLIEKSDSLVEQILNGSFEAIKNKPFYKRFQLKTMVNN